MSSNEQLHTVKVLIALKGDDPEGIGVHEAHDLVKEALEHMGWELAHPNGMEITLVKVETEGATEDVIFGDEDED